MKKGKYNFEEPDLSRYHILTYDELLRVNGGSGSDSDDNDDETVGSESGESSDEGAETATESTTGEESVGEPSADPTSESTSSGTNSESESGGHEIENTVEAVANAEVGDTLTRDDGTQVTITEGDITWAQEHCDSYGKNGEEEKEESPAKESDLPSAEEADCSKTEQEEGGSRRIENSDEAVANAKPGDTLVRDDGTVVTLKEIDIEQAQEKLGIGEHKEDEKSPSKEGDLAEKSSGENKNTKGENAANLPGDYKNYPVFPDYSEERAYINSKLDTPKGNSSLGSTNLQIAIEPESKINWNEIRNGSVDIVAGLIGMIGGGALTAGSTGLGVVPGYLAFQEGAAAFCYGIAEIGSGFQGRSIPPSTDLLIEQVTFGLAETGFDKMGK